MCQWKTLTSDKDAKFDREIEIDGSLIAPQVTWGTSPEMVSDIDGLILILKMNQLNMLLII